MASGLERPLIFLYVLILHGLRCAIPLFYILVSCNFVLNHLFATFSCLQIYSQLSAVPPHYSSLENLLTGEGTSSSNSNLATLKRRPHYGSTESISSLGSQKGNMNGGGKPSRMTQTPTSLYRNDVNIRIVDDRLRENPTGTEPLRRDYHFF